MPAEAATTHFQKPENRESVLYRKSNFTDNLSDYDSGKIPWKNNVHHMLVCCLFKQAKIGEAVGNDADKTRYVNDCLWVTKWDVNRSENLIMLPLWSTYIEAYTKASAAPNPAPPLAGPNELPAHTRDHSGKMGYTEEVKDWLAKNIWDSLNVKQEPHTADLETILGQLEIGETAWRGELTTRPASRGGTWNSWQTRATNTTWYEAFSMSLTPKFRTAP